MYYIYTDGITDFEINFSQIGIKIRRLDDNEQNEIVERYNFLYNQKNYFNKVTKNLDYKYISTLMTKSELDFSDKLIEAMVYEWKVDGVKPVFHKEISTIFNHLMVIEIEDEKLKKYIEPVNFNDFVKQLIKFSFVFDDENISLEAYERSSMIYRRTKWSETDEIIIRHLYNNFKTPGGKVFYASKKFDLFCKIMSNFLNKLSDHKKANERIFRFIEILEMYTYRLAKPQNLLINDVLTMESLVIKEDSSTIAKDFVLKAALLLKSTDLKYNLEECIYILDYLYSVRSDIVHGNTEKLLTDYAKLKEKLPTFDCKVNKNTSKMRKKNNIIFFSHRLSRVLLVNMLKLWLMKPEEFDTVRNFKAGDK